MDQEPNDSLSAAGRHAIASPVTSEFGLKTFYQAQARCVHRLRLSSKIRSLGLLLTLLLLTTVLFLVSIFQDIATACFSKTLALFRR